MMKSMNNINQTIIYKIYFQYIRIENILKKLQLASNKMILHN
jgi:hypothetical protein